MNEELQEQLSEAIRKTLDVAEKTGGFIMDQAPELLQEFYKWKVMTSLYGIIMSILLIAAVRYIPQMWLSKEKRYQSDIKFFNRWGDDRAIIAWLIFCFGSLFAAICIAIDISIILQIIFTPKMYIINYFLK